MAPRDNRYRRTELLRYCRVTLLVIACILISGCRAAEVKTRPRGAQRSPAQAAEGMIQASQGRLAPVYSPLAEHIVSHLQLADAEGVGIDLGSGPGTLIIELAKRTKLHWINADINPHFFTWFHALAEKNGLSGRVSSIMADAQDLPLRDNYADVIVSRGSYHFWPDRQKAFSEVYRVLKPGGVAFLGRGFSPNLPLDTARNIRQGQGKSMNYPFEEKAEELRTIMKNLNITDFKIHDPSSLHDRQVNYGIWIEFHKPPQ